MTNRNARFRAPDPEGSEPGLYGRIEAPDPDEGGGRRFSLEEYDVPFAVKQVELVKADDGSEEGIFQGFASTFNNKDFQDDIILPGAFKSARAERTRMLWQHDPGQVIGVWEELSENDKGLVVKGRLIMSVQKGYETFQLLKHKAVDALSVGFRVANPKKDIEFDEDTGIRRIKSVDLWEVSVVTFPANPKARISRVKMALADDETPDIRDLETALRDVGMSQSQAKRLLAEGYKGLVQRDVVETDPEYVGAQLRRFDDILQTRNHKRS